MGRWVVRIGLGLLALGALAWGALRLYVGSDSGRELVERKVDEKVAPVGGHIKIGMISGTLLGGVTLDEVAWVDASGASFFQARRVTVKSSAVAALAHHPAVSIKVEAPEVDLDRIRAGADLAEGAKMLDAEIESLGLERLEVVDGTVVAGGKTLRGVALVGSAKVEKDRRLGDRGSLRLESFTARVGGVPVEASGALEWDETAGRLRATGLAMHVGASAAVVEGGVDGDRVDVRLAKLRLAPEDLRRLGTNAPKHAVVAEARLVGPLERVVVSGWLRPDGGKATLEGTIDARARRGNLALELKGVEAEYTTAVVDGKVEARGAVDGEDVLTATWTAYGVYSRRRIDPNLQRRVAAVTPGGNFHAEGRMVLEGGKVRGRYRVSVDDPGQAARLVAGRDRDLPDSKPLVIEGTLPER